jgi:hypothetical protein
MKLASPQQKLEFDHGASLSIRRLREAGISCELANVQNRH